MRCALRTPAFAAGLTAVAATLTLTFGAIPAFAVHDEDTFELDGNAMNGPAPGIDWGTMFPSGSWSGAVVSSFVADGSTSPPDASYFTSGGSKDSNDISQWAFTTGDVAPDKDQLADAFAVAYRAQHDTGKTNVGDLLFAFGSDRFADNGDSQIGFWFFRGPVALGAGSALAGTHTVGDLLVLSDFTQGGRVSTVRVFRWVGSGGSNGSLDLLANGADCSSAAPDDAVCSEGNTAPVTSPWPYTPKSGPSGSFPQGSFLEGGLNVTRLEPGVACFSSFLAETRSSQAIGAQLKDLVLGPFDTCPRSPLTPAGGAVATGLSSGQLPATGANVAGHGLAGFDLIGIGGFLRLAGRRRKRFAASHG